MTNDKNSGGKSRIERFNERFGKMPFTPPPAKSAPPPKASESPTPKKKRQVVVSVINLKGGVGKTTVTALLADYAFREGLNVLAVDLDPQANLSQALMTQWEYKRFMDDDEPSIVNVFRSYSGKGKAISRNKCVQRPYEWRRRTGDDSRGLLVPSRFDFADELIRPLRKNDCALKDFIKKQMRDRDLVMIDCAPTESVLTRAAYHASTHILIPVKTEFFSTIGFPLLRKSLEDFKKDNADHKIEVCGVLINKGGTTGVAMDVARQQIREQADEYKWYVFPMEMRYSAGFQKWMTDMGYLGKYMQIFRPIAKKFMERVGLITEGEEL